MYLAGDFQEKESAILAIRDLRANGFTTADLDVFSDEPVEFPHGVLERPSRMSLMSVLGAITFLVLTLLFVHFAQYNYPLNTGGMPLFSFWATGVIFYELTMLGAVVTTFVWFLWESGLMRRVDKAPVPRVEPGLIHLRVRCNQDKLELASLYLDRAGAMHIRKLGDSR